MPRMVPYGIAGLPKFGDRLQLTKAEQALLERAADLGERIAALFEEGGEAWMVAKHLEHSARELSAPYDDGY